MSACLSIGELAKETGVKVVTIRYYERVGILPAPARTMGNYRMYSQAHAGRLRFVRRCRDLGFALDQIRDLLRLSSEDAKSCADVCAIAEGHLQAIEEKVADLKRLVSELRRIHSSCSGNRPMPECRIIDAPPMAEGYEAIRTARCVQKQLAYCVQQKNLPKEHRNLLSKLEPPSRR